MKQSNIALAKRSGQLSLLLATAVDVLGAKFIPADHREPAWVPAPHWGAHSKSTAMMKKVIRARKSVVNTAWGWVRERHRARRGYASIKLVLNCLFTSPSLPNPLQWKEEKRTSSGQRKPYKPNMLLTVVMQLLHPEVSLRYRWEKKVTVFTSCSEFSFNRPSILSIV